MPRDFRQGVFKWRTTASGALPTDEDLDRTIRVGVSGTEMVPFGDVLSRENRAAVIEYIKSFAPKFRDPEAEEARKPVALPAERAFLPSPDSIAAGKALFAEKGCAACHGENGDGNGPVAAALMDGWGQPLRPWDFTRGYYKSGPSDADLFRTLTTGLNGTPMPPFGPATSEEERWKLVDYLRSLGRQRSGWLYALFVSEPTGVVYDGN
jgi:cytochrome c oxidase cbb3-type subunit 2